jgi:hypothetical protein
MYDFMKGLISLGAGLVASVIVRNIHEIGIKSDINRECEAITAHAIQNYVHSNLTTTAAESPATRTP